MNADLEAALEAAGYDIDASLPAGAARHGSAPPERLTARGGVESSPGDSGKQLGERGTPPIHLTPWGRAEVR